LYDVPLTEIEPPPKTVFVVAPAPPPIEIIDVMSDPLTEEFAPFTAALLAAKALPAYDATPPAPTVTV
jgi:hypothetical protein